MIKMEKCEACGKSMPKHILLKHLAKTHGVTSPEEPRKDDVNVGFGEESPLESTTEAPEQKKWYDLWDAGPIRVCAQCREEWPDRLMAFHLIKHGL